MYAHVLNMPKKSSKILITNKVYSVFVNSLSISSTYPSIRDSISGFGYYISTLNLLWMLLVSASSWAQTPDVKIELITIGPGQHYWEAFGHTALRVKTSDADYMYGFGYFDFEDEDFFINFAKGEMRYFMGIQETQGELADYENQGRKIWSQQLNLSASQKTEMLNTLNFLAQPQNRYYHYDYFLNNCTSRIRDILDKITNKDISSQLEEIQSKKSWNDLTFPAINQAWMNLGIAMAYGLPAYENRNQWQLSVFPETFAKDLDTIKTSHQWNQPMLLINQPNKEQSQLMHYSVIKTHYAMPLILIIIFLGFFWKYSTNLTINVWLFTESLLGIGLLMLWFFTKHAVIAENINVLLFFPLSFLLIFKAFRKKWILTLFLIINIAWIVLAVMLTNLYLLGFCLVNVFIWKKLSKRYRWS